MESSSIEDFRAVRALVLGKIAEACRRSGRDAADVTLVAVSKTVDAARLATAVAAGLDVLGENRVQEAQSKVQAIPGARWHLIGPLQSNKVAKAVELFDVVESVDSLGLARRLDRLASDSERHSAGLGVYLQVNVDRDEAKSGFLPEVLQAELPELSGLPHLRLLGLMTVGRLTGTAEEARPTFVALRGLRDRLRALTPSLGPGLSMGMTGDYEVAVEEGATLVRVGRAIFGTRQDGPRPPVAGR